MALTALALASSGCSLFHEDLDPCAVKPDTRTSVRFVYDYNTDDADKFAEQVGGVTLYVFDDADRLVAIEERSNAMHGNILKHEDFTIDFDSDIIVPGKSYSFYAVAHAHERGYEGAISLPGAAFRRSELMAGVHTPADFSITLDSDGDGIVDHQGVMIDALFVSRTPVKLDVPPEIEPAEGDPQEPDHLLEVKIPLMRVTNTLHVAFWQTDFPSKINANQYEFIVESSSGSKTLGFTGTPTQGERLKYLPVRSWTSFEQIDGVNTACINAEFGLSRIILGSDLHILVRDKVSGKEHIINSLPYLMATGNDAYLSHSWTQQEYLDRQYNFSLRFALTNSVPKWAEVSVDMLSWSKRIQLEDL